jgi:hypothetical protein
MAGFGHWMACCRPFPAIPARESRGGGMADPAKGSFSAGTDEGAPPTGTTRFAGGRGGEGAFPENPTFRPLSSDAPENPYSVWNMTGVEHELPSYHTREDHPDPAQPPATARGTSRNR